MNSVPRDTWETSRDDRIKHYFSQLSPELRRKVYEFYKMDFYLFGYKSREFL